MQTLIFLYGLTADVLGRSLYERLRAIYPEAANEYAFPVKGLDQADPRSQQVLDCLAAEGWHPATDLGPRGPDEFAINLARFYDAADLEACEYLVLTPQVELDKTLRHSQHGRVQVPRRWKKSPQPIGCIGMNVFVSAHIERLMQEEPWHHLLLREIEAVPADLPGEADPFCWEVASDLTMPPLSAAMYKVNQLGKVVSGEPGQAWMLRESLSLPGVLYRPAEYHYERDALQAIEPFDFAETLEAIGGNTPWHHLIVSQRVYQFCCKHKLKVDWKPVRLDDGVTR